MPFAENTSASLSFAVQMPMEPPASCSFAIVGHLCVLACGRLATFMSPSLVRIVAMFCESLSRSTQSAGVSSSHFETPVSLSSAARARISALVYPPALPDTHRAAAPAPDVTRKFRRESCDREAMVSPSYGGLGLGAGGWTGGWARDWYECDRNESVGRRAIQWGADRAAIDGVRAITQRGELRQ